jgi:hypothetical protein
MRTTLTLEDDVAARLERLCEGSGDSFKSVVNALLRRGLDATEAPGRQRAPYRIKPHDSGRCYLPNLDSIHDVLSRAEGDAYK